MKKIMKYIGIVFLSILLLILIPLTINILFKYDFNIWWLESEWTAGEALSFYGGLLSFMGTIILGGISIWQTKKSNLTSKRLLDKDLLESTDFIQLENRFDVSVKHNEDCKMTWSTHHKLDYGANILLEPIDEKAKKFNEYLIKLYFDNSSTKNHIKKIELDKFMCVQDSSESGLVWKDGSDSPIPLDLEIQYDKNVYLNWISNNQFYAQFKIYCDPNGCFNAMMENKVNLCIIFELSITTFSNVKTEMLYKIWISKEEKNIYKVINTNSTIKNSKIIESKD